MREYHGVNQAPARRETSRQECGNPRKEICPKENNTESFGMDAETQVAPIRRETLTPKPPANESKANRLESLTTTRWDCPIPKKRFSVVGKADAS